MSRSPPCPDLVHLRLFFHKPTSFPAADSVRAHLAQCEVCRGIVAGLEAGDMNQNTLAQEAVVPARRVMPSADPMEVFRVSTGDRAKSASDARVWLPVGEAEDGETLHLSDSQQVANREGKNDATETCCFLSGDDSSQIAAPDELCYILSGDDRSQTGASDETRYILPGDASGQIAASDETRCILPGYDSGQIAASCSATSSAWRDDPDRLIPSAATLAGVTVPGYDILEELGRGGMGVVYKARHRRLQRLVALKMVLAGAHVGQIGLARFRAEAEAVAKLLHSNIVQIYETGEHDGRPYFSLEFVEGGSLDKRMSESPTSPRAAARFVETLARTMEFAHQRGIVHRDLKPANILLAKIGSQSSVVRNREVDSSSLPADHWSRTTVPKIADFGLVKRMGDDSSQTQSGAILGTPSYMAPEQAGGKNREIGPAVDIYSLGAILYELLVGRPPFKAGNPIDTVRQVIEQEPVKPRQLEPRVPHDLETICLKCLEKDPTRRFTSAADLAEDLGRFVDGDPILARPTPAWERAWKWGKHRPAIVALLGVSTLFVLGMVLFIVWHNVSLRGKLDVALVEERRARQREHVAVEEQRLSLVQQEGRKLFDSARVAVAASDWSSARLHLEKALTTIGSEARAEDLREPAQALLTQVEQELRVDADRRASQARFQKFVNIRDEAQFLGTLYKRHE